MNRCRAAWLALGLLGVALLVPFQAPALVAAVVVCLIAFVAAGVWLIAAPAFLTEDD
jgi:hypothetical protein